MLFSLTVINVLCEQMIPVDEHIFIRNSLIYERNHRLFSYGTFSEKCS